MKPNSQDSRRQLAWLAGGAAALALLGGCTSGPEGLPGTAAPVVGPSSSTGGTGLPTPSEAAGSGAPTPGSGTPSDAGTGGGSGAASEVGPVAVSTRVMLRARDWPGGKVLREAGTGPEALQQTEPAACQDRTAFPSDRYRVAARMVSIGSDAPESGGLGEVVVRYAPGKATQAMTEMRRVLAACHRYRPTGTGPGWTRSYRLEAERFTGADALLVRRSDRLDGTTRNYSSAISVVQVGDALITTTTELGEGTVDPALARRLAAVGADRAACMRTTC